MAQPWEWQVASCKVLTSKIGPKKSIKILDLTKNLEHTMGNVDVNPSFLGVMGPHILAGPKSPSIFPWFWGAMVAMKFVVFHRQWDVLLVLST